MLVNCLQSLKNVTLREDRALKEKIGHPSPYDKAIKVKCYITLQTKRVLTFGCLVVLTQIYFTRHSP